MSGYTEPVPVCGTGPDDTVGLLTLLRTLTIETNMRTHGPIGQGRKDNFKFPPMGSKIIGFHGYSGLWLDGIGAYYEPIPDPSNVVSAGPIGGNGEDSWDDGPHTAVRHLIIYSSSVIESIQIEYDDKGRSKLAEMHGRQGPQGGIKNTVSPNFYLFIHLFW